MSQSRPLPSATAPSDSGARAHTRAYTKQLAELEPSLSLPIRQPEISPSFIHLLHPSTPPPSGRKHDRPHYIGSDTSSDDVSLICFWHLRTLSKNRTIRRRRKRRRICLLCSGSAPGFRLRLSDSQYYRW